MNKLSYILFFSYILLSIICIYTPSYVYDIDFWNRWAFKISTSGLFSIYLTQKDFNYPPILGYILKIIFIDCKTFYDISHYAYRLKIFTLFFDFFPLYFAYKYVKFVKIDIKVLLYFLMNIALFYNTMFWGQIDAIYTCMCFVAITAIILNKNIIGIPTFVLSLLVKLQGIVFLPLVFLLVLFNIINYKKLKEVLIGFGISIILIFIISYPFIKASGYNNFIATYIKSIGYYPILSFNAYNIWYFFHKDVHRIVDTYPLIYNLNFHQIGLILFCIFSFVTLIPLFVYLYRILKKKQSIIIKYYFELVMLTSAILFICFFNFNTQMHERYSHPMVLFMGMYAISSEKWKLYILASIFYFINLEGVNNVIFGQPKKIENLVHGIKFIDNPIWSIQYSNELIVSFIFQLIFIYSIYILYKFYFKK